LGDWGEGQVFLNDLPKHTVYYGVEPLEKYCQESWERGFPGLIGRFIAWDVTGENVVIGDRKMKTSVFCKETDPRRFSIPTIRLDDLQTLWKIPEKPTLLWLDCEGSELHVLAGARKVLSQVKYVICEHREKPPFPGWATTSQIFDSLEVSGFDHKHQIRQDGLFVKNYL